MKYVTRYEKRNRCKYNVKLSGTWGDSGHPDEDLVPYPPDCVSHKARCRFCVHGISFFSGDKVSTHPLTDGIEEATVAGFSRNV